jgi:hypothetical protein
MLYAYVERFDVMGGRGNILGEDKEVNKAYIYDLIIKIAKACSLQGQCGLPSSVFLKHISTLGHALGLNKTEKRATWRE